MNKSQEWIHAGSLEKIEQEGSVVVKGGIAVFHHENQVYAVDNRCPHLGFPLQLGSLCNGILTCHWHHARFDVCSGGTLDPWADDVPSYEVRLEAGEVWINTNAKFVNDIKHYKDRLREGLQHNIGIVIAKAVVGLVEAGVAETEIAEIGIEYGTSFSNGWTSGLTILTAMVRILPKLDNSGKILALYQGLVHVARSSSGQSQSYLLGPLPSGDITLSRLIEWYRNCVEVRDTQGAERVLLTAIQLGASEDELAEMMLMAVTDHFYLDGGHTFDFHNKAFESLAFVDSKHKNRVLASLLPHLGNPTRSEELHQWQAPLNLVTPLLDIYKKLESIGPESCSTMPVEEEETVVQQLLSDKPIQTMHTMLELLTRGGDPAQLAMLVALAASERVVRFHTQNDHSDWISVLHTFTYAHAVHERIKRSKNPLLIRGIFHGALSVFLDRFLNVPAAARPREMNLMGTEPESLLSILDQRQQVSEAAAWVIAYLNQQGNRQELINMLGHAMLREDANFHTFQMYEAAVCEHDAWGKRSDSFAIRAQETMLLALTRYLAAHAPTARELSHTARIAWRLHKGEKLFED